MKATGKKMDNIEIAWFAGLFEGEGKAFYEANK